MFNEHVNKEGNPFRELWQEYINSLTRYERLRNEPSRKKKDIAKFKLRLACKMHILNNLNKFKPVDIPEKPNIRVTNGSDLPDEYYEWALQYKKAINSNLTNKSIIRETIEFFKQNRDKIASFDDIEEKINEAELMLELFPKFESEERAKDHFVKYSGDDEVEIKV